MPLPRDSLRTSLVQPIDTSHRETRGVGRKIRPSTPISRTKTPPSKPTTPFMHIPPDSQL